MMTYHGLRSIWSAHSAAFRGVPFGQAAREFDAAARCFYAIVGFVCLKIERGRT